MAFYRLKLHNIDTLEARIQFNATFTSINPPEKKS